MILVYSGVYTTWLKNWELTKEAPEIFWPEQATFAKGKARSEDEKYRAKPTHGKTNFSTTLCINAVFIGAWPAGLWSAVQTKLRFPHLSVHLVDKRPGYERAHTLKIFKMQGTQYREDFRNPP